MSENFSNFAARKGVATENKLSHHWRE